MDDLSPVEVVKSGDNLTGEIGQQGLIGQVGALKATTVHVLKKHLNLTGTIKHVVTLDDVKVVDPT